MNQLYFGDCLDVLKKMYDKNKEGFIDLVYIDPPFNSKRNYNILFEDADLKDTKAQKEVFADTWSNVSYKDTLHEIREVDLDLYHFLEALDKIRMNKSLIAYLTTISIRLWYIHKVLKSTGSFYLHCDPAMSHYLKMVCDSIFGDKNFRNEIVWHYRRWTNVQFQFQSMHDIILFYTKTSKNIFNFTEVNFSDSQMKKFNRGWDSNVIHYGNKKYAQLIVYNKEKYNQAINSGRLDPARYKNIIFKEKSTTAASDVIILPSLNSQSYERLGYPTQKPEALLVQLIKTSSNEGDLVADFFCGCGTTISASQKLDRQWIGVDISHLSIGLIERRLIKQYGDKIKNSYDVHGLPRDLSSAKELATGTKGGRLQFQDWIIESKLGGVCNKKKTADGGWDGHITFELPGKKCVALIETKSGNVNVKNLREFIHVVKKQNADIGIFVCFNDQVTKPMLLAAKEEGYFDPDGLHYGLTFDKIQILTVEEILEGKQAHLPDSNYTFKSARPLKVHEPEVGGQLGLF